MCGFISVQQALSSGSSGTRIRCLTRDSQESFVSLEGNVSWNTIVLTEFLPSEKGQVYIFLPRKPTATQIHTHTLFMLSTTELIELVSFYGISKTKK